MLGPLAYIARDMGGWSAMLFWWDLMSQWQNCLSPWTSEKYHNTEVHKSPCLLQEPCHLHTYTLLPVLADLTPYCVFILRTRMVLVYQLQALLFLHVFHLVSYFVGRSDVVYDSRSFVSPILLLLEKGLLHVTPSVFVFFVC